MSRLGIVEDTLFIPMLGRIYASENFPQILYDKKALELKEKLPSGLLRQSHHNQYTLLASAARSANMDRCIQSFLKCKPNGVIIQIGCGLETTYYRCDNSKTRWYAVDLPHVMEYRQTLLPQPEREIYLSGDVFTENWIRQIHADMPNTPLFITAGGLFHYFEERKVVELLRMLKEFGNTEIIFDSVSKSGMAMMRKKYMKQMGHADAQMFFYVDSAERLAQKIGGGTRVLMEEPYYRHIPRNGLKLSTKVSMAVSDRLRMVKMVCFQL